MSARPQQRWTLSTLKTWRQKLTSSLSIARVGLLSLSMFALATPSQAHANDCLALSGANPVGSKCVIATPRTVQGTFNLAESLEITGAGNITVPHGAMFEVRITGGLMIATPTTVTGGRIVGDAMSSTEAGASISLHTTEDIVLQANARITAEANAKGKTQSYCPSSYGGSIDLNAEGDVVTAKGSFISTSAKCMAGEIEITAAGNASVAGSVLAQSLLTGTAWKYRGGGPISLVAQGSLAVKDSALISSRGLDAGADLVHLQGGCQVEILGLVESTGPGHVVPTNPPNRCNLRNRPHNTTIDPMACVEVWSGGSLIIDRTGTRKGEINADTAQSGGTSIAWVDLFARGDITIAGNTTKYTVHANEFLTNGSGGLITVKSLSGKATTSGLAIQANSTTGGGRGGQITVESGGSTPEGIVTLGGATFQAKGSTSGFRPAGGSIIVRGLQDQVAGAKPGKLDAAGGLPNNGQISLQGCGAPAVSYTGTAIPGVATLPAQCQPTSILPSYVTLPTCGGQEYRPALSMAKSCTSTPQASGLFAIAFVGTVCNTGTEEITLSQLTADQPVAGMNIFPSLSKTVLPAPRTPATGEECATYSGSFFTANNPSTDTAMVEGQGTQSRTRVFASAPSTCAPQAGCGNLLLEAGEQCDDGNTAPGDGCSPSCQVETTAPSCGNGILDVGESCDDGNSNNSDSCRNTCLGGNQGCTIGYWKNHETAWAAPYTTTATVGGTFTLPNCAGVQGVTAADATCIRGLSTDTFLTALLYPGGNTLCDKAQLLIKQAVGGVLNGAHGNIAYPVDNVATLGAQVNAALASCDATTMLTLQQTIDGYNNLHNNSVCGQ